MHKDEWSDEQVLEPSVGRELQVITRGSSDKQSKGVWCTQGSKVTMRLEQRDRLEREDITHVLGPRATVRARHYSEWKEHGWDWCGERQTLPRFRNGSGWLLGRV